METLYLLGAGELVVGVSGFVVRPPEARKKPRVSSVLDANFERILELRPDLVLGFSDLQADIGRELCKRGVPVHLFNQRSVAEILQAMRLTGALVGRGQEADALASRLGAGLAWHAEAAASLPRRPRMFFEEWHEPLISGIRWCSELLELVGGVDVCAESRASHGAEGRIFAGGGGEARPGGRGGELVRAEGEAGEDPRPAGLAAHGANNPRPELREDQPRACNTGRSARTIQSTTSPSRQIAATAR